MIYYTSARRSTPIPFQIDEEDLESVLRYSWYPMGKYVATHIPIYTLYQGEYYRTSWRHVYLHIFLLGETPGDLQWDHINRDKMDNRRKNFRLATQSDNQINRDYALGQSGLPGIHYCHSGWQAMLNRTDGISGPRCYLGTFQTIEQAEMARQKLFVD